MKHYSHSYEVIVSNLGYTHRGTNLKIARGHFAEYVAQSRSEIGCAGGETITLMRDGEIFQEFTGFIDRSAAD